MVVATILLLPVFINTVFAASEYDNGGSSKDDSGGVSNNNN